MDRAHHVAMLSGHLPERAVVQPDLTGFSGSHRLLHEPDPVEHVDELTDRALRVTAVKRWQPAGEVPPPLLPRLGSRPHEIGRAACRERVEISVGAVALKRDTYTGA